MVTATLVLQDGTVLQGKAFGAVTDTVFELVFNTSMTGYQEILTDPSYRGQGVLFTCPHIGNVGINREDYESAIPQVSAVVVRSLSPVVSNWRASGNRNRRARSRLLLITILKTSSCSWHTIRRP